MTLSQIIIRPAALFSAVAMAFLLTIVAPQAQAASSNYYKIELVETAKKDKKIIRGTMIRCKETICRGQKGPSSNSKNMCVKIAKTFGNIKNFTAGDRSFDNEALEACNAKA